MSDDLIAFLRARLDEDEQVALAIEHDRYGDQADDGWKSWTIEPHAEDDYWPSLGALGVQLAHSYADNVITPQRGKHIARWDPARVLAEVEAKRRILDEVVDDANTIDYSLDLERRTGSRDEAEEPYVGDQLVRLLAAPFADHPDYRAEWRP